MRAASGGAAKKGGEVMIRDRNSLRENYFNPNLLIRHKESQRIYIRLSSRVVNSTTLEIICVLTIALSVFKIRF